MYWDGFNWCANMLTGKHFSPVYIKNHLLAMGELDDYNKGVKDALQGFTCMTESLQAG